MYLGKVRFSLWFLTVVFGAISFGIWGCGDTGTNASSSSTQTELEGTWVGYSLDDPTETISMLIQGNSLTFSFNGTVQYKATGTLNGTVTPKQMDYTVSWCPQNCPYVGAAAVGIYKLNTTKDTLTTAGGEPGVAARPTSFQPGQGWEVLLLVKK